MAHHTRVYVVALVVGSYSHVVLASNVERFMVHYLASVSQRYCNILYRSANHMGLISVLFPRK
jgi:hypothetical protein